MKGLRNRKKIEEVALHLVPSDVSSLDEGMKMMPEEPFLPTHAAVGGQGLRSTRVDSLVGEKQLARLSLQDPSASAPASTLIALRRDILSERVKA